MALTATTLAADLSATSLTATLTSTSSGFPAVGTMGSRQLMLIDSEWMMINYIPVANTVKILQRGYNGSAAVAHDILANVLTSSAASDFPAVPVGAVSDRPPYIDDIVTVGENGTIAAPNKNTTYMLNKATALATTVLASPTTAQNGIRATFTSQTAAAHVITAVMEDGTTGGSTTATFTAFKGASMILEAANGIWNVIAVQSVTIT